MRVYNFSAGPAALPLPVLEQARDELLDWQGGASVMEVSHRSRAFMAVAERAESDLRELLAIPPDYRVLFMQGGATAQFSAVPLNLARSRCAGGLRAYRPLVRARHQGSPALRVGRYRGGRSLVRIYDGARAGRAQDRAGRGLPALHAERNHRRRRVPLYSGHRRCAARRGHVVHDPVAATRRQSFRAHLCRRPEEHRAFRHHSRHRARRSPARGARRNADRFRLPCRRRGGLHAQYAADLRLVFCGPRVPVAQARRRR